MRVRIALAVGKEGNWYAVSGKYTPADRAAITCLDVVRKEEPRLFFLEADVEWAPQEAIVAEVKTE